MATVGLPLTGAGDATALVATDNIGGEHYQRMKLHDGLDGSTRPVRILATTPASSDEGMVVRPIGSTAFNQAVVGAVGLTSGSSAVGITSGSSAVELTSVGSTRLAARFTVDNPTTAVSLSSQLTVTASGTTKVDVSSGVVLGAGSSANIVGSVVNTSGSTAAIIGAVVVASGSTAFIAAAVSVTSGVVLGAGSSANILGSVTLAAGASANLVGSVGTFQGANLATSGSRIATSVDVSLLASGTSRVGAYIFNETTGSFLYIGFSTGVVTSAAYSYQIAAGAGQFFGGGGMPNYVGMIRGRLASTSLAGIAVVGSFTT